MTTREGRRFGGALRESAVPVTDRHPYPEASDPEMARFLIRRLLSSIPVLLGIVLLVFVLARVIPGDP